MRPVYSSGGRYESSPIAFSNEITNKRSVTDSIYNAVMSFKKRSVSVLFCTSTYTCDVGIGSEINIPFNFKATLFM